MEGNKDFLTEWLTSTPQGLTALVTAALIFWALVAAEGALSAALLPVSLFLLGLLILGARMDGGAG